MTWFYVSFAEGRFLGAVIVEAEDVVGAVTEAWRLGINPGGQALGGPIPEGLLPPPEFRRVLLTRDDVEALDEVLGG